MGTWRAEPQRPRAGSQRDVGANKGSEGSVTAGLAWATREGLQGSHLNPVCVPLVDLTEGEAFPQRPAQPGHLRRRPGLCSPSP